MSPPSRRRSSLLPVVFGLLACATVAGCGRVGAGRRATTTGEAGAGPERPLRSVAPAPDNVQRREAEAALGVSDGFARRDALRAAVRAWAAEDPEAALDWVRSLPDAALRQAGLRSLGPALAARDFARALALSADFPPGAVRDDYVREIAQVWAGSGGNPREAERWARGIGDETLRAKVLAVVAVELAQNAPAEAAALVAKAFAPGPEQDAAAVTIALRWAAADPAAAVGWAAQQPAGPGRDILLSATLGRWVTADAPAASAWVNSLPAGPLREEAVDRYVNVWADADPARALDWAVTNGRETRLAGMVHRWFTNRPEDARAWVSSAPLSDDAKYHLIYDDPREDRYEPRR